MNIQQMTARIAEYFQTQPVEKAWLFGSFARGEATKDSDVDLLIVPDASQSVDAQVVGHMCEALKKLLKRDVDIITVDNMYPSTRRKAEKEKILIYEQGCQQGPTPLSDGMVQIAPQEELPGAQEIE